MTIEKENYCTKCGSFCASMPSLSLEANALCCRCSDINKERGSDEYCNYCYAELQAEIFSYSA